MTVTLADENIILISNIDNKLALTSLKSVDGRKVSLCYVQYSFLPASFIASVCLRRYLGTWINRQIIEDKKMHSHS